MCVLHFSTIIHGSQRVKRPRSIFLAFFSKLFGRHILGYVSLNAWRFFGGNENLGGLTIAQGFQAPKTYQNH